MGSSTQDKKQRYVQSGGWIEGGHPEWVGLVGRPLAASVMSRVTAILSALGS